MRPTLARCGCAVDIHAHMVPHDFPAYLGGAAPAHWPAMAPAHACHRHVMIDGKNYRTVSDKCWSTDKRLADFDDMGLGLQVISPMPELLSYWLKPSDGAQLVRYLNEQIALMVSEAPGRLLGLGAVPLQDMDLALKELYHLRHGLGLSGVEIGSNIQGVPIGDPRLAPFFEACEALDLAVFVHALRPTGMDRLVGPAPLQQVLAYPSDVGLAAASALTGNLMHRHPRLRIAFSHGGGALPMMIPRLQHAWIQMPAVRQLMDQSPREMARRLFVDDLVYDSQAIHYLLSTYGERQVMAGTDYPFAILDRQPAQRIDDLALDEATTRLLRQDNALRWLARERIAG